MPDATALCKAPVAPCPISCRLARLTAQPGHRSWCRGRCYMSCATHRGGIRPPVKNERGQHGQVRGTCADVRQQEGNGLQGQNSVPVVQVAANGWQSRLAAGWQDKASRTGVAARLAKWAAVQSCWRSPRGPRGSRRPHPRPSLPCPSLHTLLAMLFRTCCSEIRPFLPCKPQACRLQTATLQASIRPVRMPAKSTTHPPPCPRGCKP